MTETAAILLELRALRAEVQELLALQRPQHMAASDRAFAERLLPAIGGELGSEPFTAADLLATPALRSVVKQHTPKQLGRLLARCVGVAVAGRTVQKVGGRRNQWSVLAIRNGD